MPAPKNISKCSGRKIIRRRDHLTTNGERWASRLEADAEIPVTSVGISTDIATDVVTSIQLPWKNPIEPSFFPQHRLQVFPPILEQTWP
jgi:hypothetical protein